MGASVFFNNLVCGFNNASCCEFFPNVEKITNKQSKHVNCVITMVLCTKCNSSVSHLPSPITFCWFSLHVKYGLNFTLLSEDTAIVLLERGVKRTTTG